MAIDIERVLRWHIAWASTASGALRDLSSIAAGQTVGYNLDYSVLFPYLWSKEVFYSDGMNHGEWDGVCRSVCQELLRHPLPHGTRFVFTSASFIEALDSLRKHLDHGAIKEHEWNEEFDRIKRELEDVERSFSAVFDHDLMTRRQLEDRLDKLSRKIGHRTPEALQKLRTFVAAGGPLVGVRDLAPEIDLKKYKNRFKQLYDEMERTRGTSPKETRSAVVRSLHYKIDCANIVLCEAISGNKSDTELGFVTKATNKKNLVKSHGRTSLMVLVLLRSNRLSEFSDHAGRIKYLEWMLNDANALTQELRRRSEIDESRDTFLLSAISSFEDRFVVPMYGRRGRTIHSTQEQISALRLVASTKERFKEHLASSRDSMKMELRGILEQQGDILDDELLTTFDIDTEPRAKAILERI